MRRKRWCSAGRMAAKLAVVLLVLLLVFPPQAAQAAAIPDPNTFWNALKVALGGATISSASLAAAGEFMVTGLVVGGVVIGGYLIVKAYDRWKTAHTSQGTAVAYTEANGAWSQVVGAYSIYVRVPYRAPNTNCLVYTSITAMTPIYSGPKSWSSQPWYVVSSDPTNSCSVPTLDQVYAWWLAQTGAQDLRGTSGPYWPGTTVTAPATVAEAIADPRWSTIANAVAAELDDALQADRDARAIPIPGNTEGYQSPWDVSFTNVRVGDQPVVGNPPVSQNPTQPATEGYLAQVIQWLGDVFRTQVQWLAGVVETWLSRVVTELEQVGDLIAALPQAIADAVATAVTDAIEAAFVPSTATVDAWRAIPQVATTRFPFSVPAALDFPDIPSSSCVAPEWDVNVPSFSSGGISSPSATMNLSMAALCSAGPVVRPVATFFLGIWGMTVLMKLIIPRLQM